MTEAEARKIIHTIATRLLRAGVAPQKLMTQTLRIREVAKGDPAKTVEGYRALEQKFNQLLQEQQTRR